MPTSARRICATPGCNAASDHMHCSHHRTAAAKQHHPDYGRIYHTQRWRRLRRIVLARNPLCQACLAAERVTPACDVDHIVPHRGDMIMAWSLDNLQGLCRACHSRKTAGEVNARRG